MGEDGVVVGDFCVGLPVESQGEGRPERRRRDRRREGRSLVEVVAGQFDSVTELGGEWVGWRRIVGRIEEADGDRVEVMAQRGVAVSQGQVFKTVG